MKTLHTFIFFLIIWNIAAHAQKSYTATSGETIFSIGIVDAGADDLNPVVRFSPVFNFQQQFHYDFSKSVGFYTGLGFRNVGLISHFTDSFSNTYKIKERSYSLGLPLALKLGTVEGGPNFAIGGEAELMFAYKRKIKFGNDKKKTYGWFDDHVNLFNPSIFAEVRFSKGQYVRIRYYLMDFLNYRGILLPNDSPFSNGTYLPDYGEKSPLFYISIGAVTLKKDVSEEDEESDESASAYFKIKTKKKKTSSGTGISEAISPW